MNPDERREKFRVWVCDLNDRAEAYLRLHPEQSAPEVAYQSQSVNSNKVKITILESIAFPGVWSVYIDNIKHMTFHGDEAHQQAMAAMQDLLKKYQ